jgi:hypothetical protein
VHRRTFSDFPLTRFAVESVGLAFIPLDEFLHLPADDPLCQVGIYGVLGVTRNGQVAAFRSGLKQRLVN